MERLAPVGWSPRLLSERFRAEIGLTPKTAARVVRRRLRRRVAAGQPPAALADLAVECGYHNQAHVAGELRALAGAAASRWPAAEFRNLQALAGGSERSGRYERHRTAT